MTATDTLPTSLRPRTRPTPTVAVVGATGAVGIELLRVLEKRRFPLSGCACSPRRARPASC
jgi:aspartate-semialdehyde dehydrogenase